VIRGAPTRRLASVAELELNVVINHGMHWQQVSELFQLLCSSPPVFVLYRYDQQWASYYASVGYAAPVPGGAGASSASGSGGGSAGPGADGVDPAATDYYY
jgi:hypothetical protein